MVYNIRTKIDLLAAQAGGVGKRNILSFGGNGMIGSAVLDRLIKMEIYNITMVSRGSWHYDSNIRIKVTSFNV